METKANFVLVGAFVMVLLAAIGGFVLWLARPQTAEAARYLIYFTGDVTGLAQGSVVRYQGIRVGEVTSVRLDAKTQQIEVVIEVRQGTPIKLDTIARLEIQGLTGVPHVQLKGGDPGSPRLEPAEGKSYAEIRSERSNLQQVFESLPKVLVRLITLADEATKTAEKTNDLLSDENRAAFSESLRNVRDFTRSINNSSDDIELLITDAGKILGMTKDLVDDLRPAIKDIRAGAKGLRSAATQIDAFVAENREPVRDFSATGLYELSHVLTEMRTLIQSLTRITAKLETDPARYLFGDTQRGYEAR